MTRFVALTGTAMRKSVRDIGHLVRWALKHGSPVPLSDYELDQWALCLDDKVGELDRKDPGALAALCPEINPPPNLEQVRAGFRRRLLETAGVVSTSENSDNDVEAALYIRPLRFECKPITDEHFKTLRKTATTPAGWSCAEAAQIYAHALEMALGLCYRWDPFPPKNWLDARKEWASQCRQVLSYSRKLDSELQVVQACDAGLLAKTVRDALVAWRTVKPTFTPNTVPVWFDDSALKAVAKWMAEGPGLVWVEHRLFAQELSRITGAPYFGAKSRDALGREIDDPKHHKELSSQSVIASIDSCREGKNLQKHWSRMLYTSFPPGSDAAEQSIARLHRPDQEAEEVVVDVVLNCLEHHRSVRKAVANAQVVKDTTGAYSKLLGAEIDWPEEDELARLPEGRWR